jgi:hypothetical protein
MLHYSYTQRRAFIRDSGAAHQLNAFIFQDFFLRLRHLCLRIPAGKCSGQVRLLCVKRNKLPATADHSIHLRINMTMIDADDRKPHTWFCRIYIRLFDFSGLFYST